MELPEDLDPKNINIDVFQLNQDSGRRKHELCVYK